MNHCKMETPFPAVRKVWKEITALGWGCWPFHTRGDGGAQRFDSTDAPGGFPNPNRTATLVPTFRMANPLPPNVRLAQNSNSPRAKNAAQPTPPRDGGGGSGSK